MRTVKLQTIDRWEQTSTDYWCTRLGEFKDLLYNV